MRLYILIHEQDTDSAWGSSAKPFIDRAAAQDTMRQDYEDNLHRYTPLKELEREYARMLENHEQNKGGSTT